MTEQRLAQIRAHQADQLVRWNPVVAISDRRELLAEVDRLRAILAAQEGKPSLAPRPSRLGRALGALPDRLRWIPHNAIGHPLSEALYQVGLRRWSDRVHDSTIPAHKPGTGRG